MATYAGQITVADGETETYLFGEIMENAGGVEITPAGSAKVQFTFDYTATRWFDSLAGTVTDQTAMEIPTGCYGLRVVSSSGEVAGSYAIRGE